MAREVAILNRYATGLSSGRPKVEREWTVVIRVFASAVLLVGSYAVSTAAGGASSAIAECTPQLVSEQTQPDGSLLRPQQAASDANHSSVLARSALAENQSDPPVYLGVFQLSSVDDLTCAVTIDSIDVAYLVQTGVGASELTLSENPRTGNVTNATIEGPTQGAIAHATYIWSGWSAGPCASCAVHGSYAQWQNFPLSIPSGDCGASETLVGVCGISFWSGLTASSGGGGSPEGIAQSGFNAWLDCGWVAIEFVCQPWYQGWYEFWPQDKVAINCFSFTSPSNEVLSEVSWASPSTYYAQIWDVTTGQDCSPYGETTMAMGQPYYAQFQAEAESNGIGGWLDVPGFSTLWFNPAVALGDPLNLNQDSPGLWNQISGVSVQNPISFNSNACAGPGESCFYENG